MASNELRQMQMEAFSRLGGCMPEMNGFRHAPLLPVKIEESDWVDPICSLFQTKDQAETESVSDDAGGSSTIWTPFKERQRLSTEHSVNKSAPKPVQNVSRVSPLVPSSWRRAVSTDHSSDQRVASKPLQNVTRRAPLVQDQETLFLSMGFPRAHIQRAILLHGAEADDSIILQFLLDCRDKIIDVPGSQDDQLMSPNNNKAVRDDCRQPNNNKAADEEISGVSTIQNPTQRNDVFVELSDSEDSDSSQSDIEATDPVIKKKLGSPPPTWNVKKEPDYEPDEERCRNLISNYGFSAQLVERALDELGYGVDYDVLLDHLLHASGEQESRASTAEYVHHGKRASKEAAKGSCRKRHASSKSKLKSAAELLVEECGYTMQAVEHAALICGTPLWNPSSDQMADLVDFLEAQYAGTNQVEEKEISDDEVQEVSAWSWLQGNASPKRKLGAPRRKSTIRRNRPQSSNRARIGRPPRVVPEAATTLADRHHGSTGFGLPGKPTQPRYLEEDLQGAPFFYFENVASMPNDEWERIRRHLFDIEPEFVDSLHFSACRRPRGYIHNLPIEGRRKILPDPPMTIQELLPHTKEFWPSWDVRTKLNCITTRIGSEFLIKKLHIGEGTALQTDDPSPEKQREILHLCRHWNLVWTAPNIPTPINDVEIEAMLGFDAGHTRNILSNRAKYKALGNSFSVYTVAYHFSVLKPLYPRGVKVLSLFSGIGGAEVALHKMGVKLQVVVSVEIDDGTRRCLEAWWASSKQTGILNQNYHNVKELGRAQISELVSTYGGFDLIVGGTPCNNLSGSNHVTRVGLDGSQSTIFFEFSRVVAAVRELSIRLQRQRTC